MHATQVIVYLMGGLKLTAGAFFANWAAIMLLVLTAQSLGLLLGAIFMNPKTAQTVGAPGGVCGCVCVWKAGQAAQEATPEGGRRAHEGVSAL